MPHFIMLVAVLVIAAEAPDPATGSRKDGWATASDTLRAATLRGIVRARGSMEPLPHATVRVVELRRDVPTDDKGYFVLGPIPPGRWRVEASAIGYEAHGMLVVVSSETVRLDFELQIRPVPLPVLEVRSAPAGEPETTAAPPHRTGPSVARIHSRALRTLPALAEADVLRSLQALPSVAAMSDFSSALYIRGGAADQTGVTLDGMPLFNPYHAGGLFSAIPVDVIAAVDVWPGASPARSMDRLSGVVDIHSRDGARDRIHASGGVGLLASSVTLDGPIGSGSFLLAGRRTYIDAITGAAYAMRLIDVTVPYSFSDVYGKISLPSGELGSIALSGYHNAESLGMPERMRHTVNGGSGPDFDWGSSMAAINWRRPLSPSLLLEARLGISAFRGAFEAWEMVHEAQDCPGSVNCTAATSSTDSTHVLSATTRNSDLVAGVDATLYRARHTVRAGLQLDSYRHDHDIRQFDDLDSARVTPFHTRGAFRTVALHVEDEWRGSDAVSARLGARVLFAGDLGTALMPRGAVNVHLTRRVSASLGGGGYAQALRSLRNDESVVSSFSAYELFASQPAAAGLAHGWDAVAGFAVADVATAVRAELYTRRLNRLVLQQGNSDPLSAPWFVVQQFSIGEGTARGLELTAQHRFRRAEQAVSYALSFADREADGHRYPARFERRHMVDATSVWYWGTGGMVSVRGLLGSGQPYAPDGASREHDELQPHTTASTRPDYNSSRMPRYLRVDIAARRDYSVRWFGRPTTVTPYVQVINVMNSRNAVIGQPDTAEGESVRRMPHFPIMPSFGFEWRN